MQRTLTIDVRPLDRLVQQTIYEAVAAVINENNSGFGSFSKVPIGALTLGDLARYYLKLVADRYDLQVRTAFNPKSGIETMAVKLRDPEIVGDFCSFDSLLGYSQGVQSLRHKIGRKSNDDCVIVGYILLTFTDAAHTKGCVAFKAEFETAFINGYDGNMVGPHLHDGHLKKTSNMEALRVYARSILPSAHPLAIEGWTQLPANQHALVK